ncbi:6-phosphofructokinase [Streptomyces sp. NBC_01451]|uniref:6-phosphofructokinase n=1 Tax=Streptomyces sp. NBC_01451 TaxID=2903872 RepID=UPI002E305C0F|nr:6-phosphofructokinase [Streptomyces sp. NBC_01451]
MIRSVVRKGVQEYAFDLVGLRDGWPGALRGDVVPLDIPGVRGILPHAGTILGSSRNNPFKHEDGLRRVRDTLATHSIDALIVIGGEDTLGAATELSRQGIKLVGVPKTIDRLHTTAESHMRALVVEVTGRHSGWIALHAGIAGGANVILIPERPFDMDEVCEQVESRSKSNYAPIVVAAEGVVPRAGQMALREPSACAGWSGTTSARTVNRGQGRRSPGGHALTRVVRRFRGRSPLPGSTPGTDHGPRVRPYEGRSTSLQGPMGSAERSRRAACWTVNPRGGRANLRGSRLRRSG